MLLPELSSAGSLIFNTILQQQPVTNTTEPSAYWFCLRKQQFCDPTDATASFITGALLYIMAFMFMGTFCFYIFSLVQISRQASTILSTRFFYVALIIFSFGKFTHVMIPPQSWHLHCLLTCVWKQRSRVLFCFTYYYALFAWQGWFGHVARR